MKTPHFGRNLKVARVKRSLLQKDVAEAAGISQSYLSQIELGSRTMTVPLLWQLCQALDVHPGEIVTSHPDTMEELNEKLDNLNVKIFRSHLKMEDFLMKRVNEKTKK